MPLFAALCFDVERAMILLRSDAAVAFASRRFAAAAADARAFKRLLCFDDAPSADDAAYYLRHCFRGVVYAPPPPYADERAMRAMMIIIDDER